MPKMVLCFKDGKKEGEGKFFNATQIPKGWVIDRLCKPIPEPVLSSGLDITGQPDAFKEGDVIGEQKAPKGMGESSLGGKALAAVPDKEKNKKSKSKE